MRPSGHSERTVSRDSSTKRLLRERGTLRCWWCNKRTEVKPGFSWGGIALDEWRSFVAEHSPFYCSREHCVAHRREAMPRPAKQPVKPPRTAKNA